MYFSFSMVDHLESSWWTILNHHLPDLYNLLLKFSNGGPSWNIIYLTFTTMYLSFPMVVHLATSYTWPLESNTYVLVWWTVMKHHILDLYSHVLKFSYGGPSWNIIYLTFTTMYFNFCNGGPSLIILYPTSKTLYLSFPMVDHLERSYTWLSQPCT